MSRTIRTYPRPDCPLCGRGGEALYANLRDRLYGASGTWDLKICRNPSCEMVWLDPSPLPEETIKAYERYYTHPLYAEPKYRGQLAGRLLMCVFYWSQRFSPSFQNLQKMYLDDQPPGKLLEIGCGNGRRLTLMSSLGWDVVGQDVDPQCGAAQMSPSSIPVHIRRVEELRFPDNHFDAITMSHVIEHVPDPEALLRECVRMLKKGGKLVCVTPNAQSYGHQTFKENWINLDPPRHLNLFCPKSLHALSARVLLKGKTWTVTDNSFFFFWVSYNLMYGVPRPMENRCLRAGWRALVSSWKLNFRTRRDKALGDELVLYASK